MKFSIVIPLYNKAPYIEETLKSLVEQHHRPHELIIVDDNSTDGSLELAKQFLVRAPLDFQRDVKVNIIELSENRGPGHARNLGFTHTSGEVVAFLDADDLYPPALIESAAQQMQSSQIDFLVVGIQRFPSGAKSPQMDKLEGQLTPIANDAYLLEQPLKTVSSHAFVMGTGSNVFAKRQWLSNTQYVENVSLNEANDFWFRVLNLVIDGGGKVGLLMKEMIRVREVEQSLSRLTYQHWREIEVPPIYVRSLKSNDLYEKLLAGVICNRWLKHSLSSLASNKQKLIFIFKYRAVFMRQLHYFFLRLSSK